MPEKPVTNPTPTKDSAAHTLSSGEGLPERGAILGWVMAALIVLLALGLRLHRLGAESLWLDEGFTAFQIRFPVGDMLARLAQEDNHPPLHYLLLHFWVDGAGWSEFSLRFPSALAGVLAVATIVRLGRRLMGWPAGLAAGLLLAISPFHIWYSQEARMYALVGFLSLASVCLLVEAARRPSLRIWALYALTTGLSLLTHYFAFLVLLAQLPLAPFLLGRRRLKEWLGAVVAAGFIYLPWLPSQWHQLIRAPGGYRTSFGLGDIASQLLFTFSLGEERMPESLATVPWGFLALAGVGLVSLVGRPRAAAVLISWLALPVIIVYVLTQATGLDLRAGGRMYYIVILGAFILFLARGVAVLPGRLLPAVALAFLVVSTLLALETQSRVRKEDFRRATAYIQRKESPDEAIVLNAEHIYPPFAYYYRGRLEWHRTPLGDPAPFLAEVSAGKEGIWLVISHEWLSDPQGLVKAWLDRWGYVEEEAQPVGVRILHYRRSFPSSQGR